MPSLTISSAYSGISTIAALLQQCLILKFTPLSASSSITFMNLSNCICEKVLSPESAVAKCMKIPSQSSPGILHTLSISSTDDSSAAKPILFIPVLIFIWHEALSFICTAHSDTSFAISSESMANVMRFLIASSYSALHTYPSTRIILLMPCSLNSIASLAVATANP